jgi:hypothetical protein
MRWLWFLQSTCFARLGRMKDYREWGVVSRKDLAIINEKLCRLLRH